MIYFLFAVIVDIFSRTSAVEVLQDLSMPDMEEVWTEIASQSEIREEYIKQLHSALHAVETDRIQLVSSIAGLHTMQLL